MLQIKPYKKSFEYSYTLGAFPTIELLKCKPKIVDIIYMHSSFTDSELIYKLCSNNNIKVEINDKLIAKLSDKENVYVIGVFYKYSEMLEDDKSHIVLVNPSNMGNLGTIIRTAAGFNVNNLAVINPGADIFNPKVVRSSMGALFRIKAEYFDDFESYRVKYPKHNIYTFMLNATKQLKINDSYNKNLFSLVFGNEATGLDDSYLNVGQSIIIPQSDNVDSLNLTIAVGIGLYVFSNK